MATSLENNPIRIPGLDPDDTDPLHDRQPGDPIESPEKVEPAKQPVFVKPYEEVPVEDMVE